MDVSEPAIDRFIPRQTRTKPPTNIYVSWPVTQVYFLPPMEFLRIMQDPDTESIARACRARDRAGICVSR
eukprot:COSAG02_NODE_5731_length_4083_cov_2.935492_1_plen_70_part_00